MKLIWCPETASKAYIDTVKSVNISPHHPDPLDSDRSESSSSLLSSTGVAELISAMAGGWKPQLIVETWVRGGPITTSIGLASASRHTCGRHVCIVPDERSKLEYLQAMQKAGMNPEVMVGDVEEAMNELVGVDFLVVDCRRKDWGRMLKVAKLSHRGAVLVCKNASARSNSVFRWRSAVGYGARVVRCAYLPVGKGLDIAHVGGSDGKGTTSRWIRHMDESGEEHVFRR